MALRSEGLSQGNDVIVNSAKKFIELYNLRWTKIISTAAISSKILASMNSERKLPSADDIQGFLQHIKKEE
jgi:hypothetical protein